MDAHTPDSGFAASRRNLLKAAGATTALGALAAAFPTTADAAVPAAVDRTTVEQWMRESVAKPTLRFHADGSFRVLQFNDTQDHHLTDKRTLELLTKGIKAANPDLVILNGDNINGGPQTLLQHKQAINNVAATLEESKVPWAITFGNHDEDSTEKTGLNETGMLKFYMQYEHNVNIAGAQGLTGTGNMYLPIMGSKNAVPAFGIWLMDSGRYAPEKIADQELKGYPKWDWIRARDLTWYHSVSTELEKRYQRKVSSMMFIHIPLWEHRFMWYSSVDERSDELQARGKARHFIDGERNEDECPGPFNSGLFSAIVDRGETRSVSCGHDHVNAYWGDYYGIKLGYSPGSGYGAYGLGGERDHYLRGCRLFNLRENNPTSSIESTKVIYARELGIDVTAGNQRITEPLPFPKGVI